jgi:hypothetical protein
MRLTPFLLLIILAFPLSGQEKLTSAVENLVHDYCGDDPILSYKEVATLLQRSEKRLYDQCVERDPLSDCTAYAAKNTEVSQWRHPLGTDNREKQNDQVKSYLHCREMVVAKALDAHVVALKEENERLRKALQSICVLPDNRMAIRQACAALLQPKP